MPERVVVVVVVMSERPKRILVVDDSETFLMYISILLRRMGFDKIIPADNGIEALKLLRILMPDVVMLDITMPQMNGITVLRHIKCDEHTSNIPVIMVRVAPGMAIEFKELNSEDSTMLNAGYY